MAISSYTFRHHSRTIIRRMERSTTTLYQVQTMESDNPDGGLRLQRERGSAADRGDAVWSSRRPGKSCGPGGQDRHQEQRNGHRAFRCLRWRRFVQGCEFSAWCLYRHGDRSRLLDLRGARFATHSGRNPRARQRSAHILQWSKDAKAQGSIHSIMLMARLFDAHFHT